MLCLSARTLSEGENDKEGFNTVPRPMEDQHHRFNRMNQLFVRDEEDTQTIFRACSQYLERRGASAQLHKEIEEHERFVHHLKGYSKGAADPPIVLRGEDGEQEFQLALYHARAKYERQNYGKTIELPPKENNRGDLNISVQLPGGSSLKA